MALIPLSDERLAAICLEVEREQEAQRVRHAQQQFEGHTGRDSGLACFQCGDPIKPGSGEVCADCLRENG